VAKSKAMCVGCRDNFYNHNQPDGCWCFASAKIVRRVRVGIWEPPPYSRDRAEKYLSCFTRDGYAMLSLDDGRVVFDVAATRKRWDRENEQRAAEAAERGEG